MIRFILGVILLACSLLVVFRAPTNFTWRMAVAVTEFPLIGILISTVLLFWNWKQQASFFNLSLNILSILLFCLPIINAYSIGFSLKNELSIAFGKTPFNQKQSPYSFLDMVFRSKNRPNTFQTLVYGLSVKGDLTADFYKGTKQSKAPTVILIHGGSWQEGNGDCQQLPDLNPYLAGLGYNVVTMNYRLAPTYKYPAPVEDVKQLMRYLCEHHEEYKIDTNSFVLIGRSAGGQIALQAAYTEKDPRIKGVVSFYAPADMAWGARILTNDWVLDVDKVLVDYIGTSVKQKPELYDLASAPPFVNSATPPTLLIHGENDAMVSYHHTERLAHELKQNKVPYYVLHPKFATHGCDYAFHGPSGQLSTYAIEYFLSAVTQQYK